MPRTTDLPLKKMNSASKSLTVAPLKIKGESTALPRVKTLGFVIDSLAAFTGIADELRSAIRYLGQPWCRRCKVAGAVITPTSLITPQPGATFILAVPPQDLNDDQISATEFADYFGANRVVHNSRLLSLDVAANLFAHEVSPVVLTSSAEFANEGEHFVKSWWRKHQTPLQLFIFSDRESEGVCHGFVSGGVACPQCGESLDRLFDDAFSACSMCAGEGWLIRGGSVTACSSCFGMAIPPRAFDLRIFGEELDALKCFTARKLLGALSSNPELTRVSAHCELLVALGLGELPLGLRSAGLSFRERSALNYFVLTSAAVPGLVVDAGILGEGVSKASEQLANNRLRSFNNTLKEANRVVIDRANKNVDRELGFLGLAHDKFSFAINGLTILYGQGGSGKTIVLREANELVRRRTKEAARIQAVGIKKSCLVTSNNQATISLRLIDILAIAERIAALFANQFESRRRGLSEKSFVAQHSDRPCPMCHGENCESCVACDGLGLDSIVLNSKFGGLPVREILRTPISTIRSVLGHDEIIEIVLGQVENLGYGDLTLSTKVNSIEIGGINTLRTVGALSRVFEQKMDGLLVLLDEPLFGLSERSTKYFLQIIDSWLARGASVVLATGEPELVSLGDHVVQLSSITWNVYSRASKFEELFVPSYSFITGTQNVGS